MSPQGRSSESIRANGPLPTTFTCRFQSWSNLFEECIYIPLWKGVKRGRREPQNGSEKGFQTFVSNRPKIKLRERESIQFLFNSFIMSFSSYRIVFLASSSGWLSRGPVERPLRTRGTKAVNWPKREQLECTAITSRFKFHPSLEMC